MLVLDTDVLSLFQTRAPVGNLVRARLATDLRPSAVTIVSVIEHFRGRMAVCMKTAAGDGFGTAAAKFREAYEFYRTWTILDFDTRAEIEFRRLKAAKVRIGTMDLRIAAIVLANGATLITRNLSHFRQVPDLRAEDWTVP